MIEPADFLRVVIDPGCMALSRIMGQPVGDDRAKVLLLAIAWQESGLEYRRQLNESGQPMNTLARGFWQFEKDGGVAGVCDHPSSHDYAVAVCERLKIPFARDDIHESLAWNDYAAMAFARLLLWTDPISLPAVGKEEEAWAYYLRNWRPGKPNRQRWSEVYPQAVTAVEQAAVVASTTQPFIAPKPGTLTTSGGTKPVQVDLPSMNRSWNSGEFWLNVLSTLGVILLALSPILEPAMDRVAESPWLLSIPLGPAIFAIARQYYKAQRIKYAAEVAAAAQVG